VRDILGDSFDLETMKLDLSELQGTMEEIVKDKCRRAADIVQQPVLVEDTSLSFNAMGEMPGPYIKWFLSELGATNLYKMLEGFDDKTAQAVYTFAFSQGAGHEPVIFQARTSGKIVPKRGQDSMPGFGWNSAFEYEGKTYAEMTKEEKDKISAISGRRRALIDFQKWLSEKAV
jgi:inosine triphosphate pyrophosphatase